MPFYSQSSRRSRSTALSGSSRSARRTSAGTNKQLKFPSSTPSCHRFMEAPSSVCRSRWLAPSPSSVLVCIDESTRLQWEAGDMEIGYVVAHGGRGKGSKASTQGTSLLSTIIVKVKTFDSVSRIRLQNTSPNKQGRKTRSNNTTKRKHKIARLQLERSQVNTPHPTLPLTFALSRIVINS